MKRLSREACYAFLRARPRTAKLATVRPNGRPHVAPVWYALDGDELIFTTWHTTVKARNLEHNPWVSICVDDEEPPFAFVKLDGTASLSTNPDALRLWAGRIADRYMGQEQAEAYGERNSVEGELLVRVQIIDIMGQDDVAGW
jgi:PPOX class probable F420-dependent enzyme